MIEIKNGAVHRLVEDHLVDSWPGYEVIGKTEAPPDEDTKPPDEDTKPPSDEETKPPGKKKE